MSAGLNEKTYSGIRESREEALSAIEAQSTILYVVDGLGLSGKTKALADLAAGLDRSEFRPVVCRFRDEGGPIEARLKSHDIKMLEAPCKDGLNFGVVRRLVRIMQDVRPTVVHCYNPRAMLYGGAAARLSGIGATIGTLSAFACLTPDREFGFLPQRLFTTNRRNRVRNRLGCRMMKYVVAVSQSLGEGFCKHNGVSLSKLRVIPYGADVDSVWEIGRDEVQRFRAGLGVAPDDVLIGSVGRLVEQKDYPTQLRAFAMASQKASGLKMALAGEGPLRKELENLARNLQVADRVIFLGHTNDVPLLLRSLDVFTMASKFEPYGVALLEAKAAGLPIISTSASSSPEIVVHGKSGLVCPAGDYETLSDAFVEIATDGTMRKQLGQQALKEVKEQNALGVVIGRYQQLYDEVKGIVPHVAIKPSVNGAHAVDQE